jgi:uncharacterized membrane protein YbhN (UPF0104 family)
MIIPRNSVPAARFRRLVAFSLRAVLGAGIVLFLLWRYDLRSVFNLLTRERLGPFATAIAVYLAGQVLSAWRWRILAALGGLAASFSDFAAWYFVGMFTNLFIPGVVGGDAARAMYLGRRSRRLGAAVASVIADRATGLIALFWLAAVAVPSMASRLPRPILLAVIVAALSAAAFEVAAPLIARLVMGLVGNDGTLVQGLMPYLLRPWELIPAFAISVTLQISIAVAQFILARGIGLRIPLSVLLVAVPIGNAVASVPMTINGLGLREASYLVILGAAGVARADAVALGLLWFAATMAGGLTGLVPLITMGPRLAVEAAIEPATRNCSYF